MSSRRPSSAPSTLARCLSTSWRTSATARASSGNSAGRRASARGTGGAAEPPQQKQEEQDDRHGRRRPACRRPPHHARAELRALALRQSRQRLLSPRVRRDRSSASRRGTPRRGRAPRRAAASSARDAPARARRASPRPCGPRAGGSASAPASRPARGPRRPRGARGPCGPPSRRAARAAWPRRGQACNSRAPPPRLPSYSCTRPISTRRSGASSGWQLPPRNRTASRGRSARSASSVCRCQAADPASEGVSVARSARASSRWGGLGSPATYSVRSAEGARLVAGSGAQHGPPPARLARAERDGAVEAADHGRTWPRVRGGCLRRRRQSHQRLRIVAERLERALRDLERQRVELGRRLHVARRVDERSAQLALGELGRAVVDPALRLGEEAPGALARGRHGHDGGPARAGVPPLRHALADRPQVVPRRLEHERVPEGLVGAIGVEGAAVRGEDEAELPPRRRVRRAKLQQDRQLACGLIVALEALEGARPQPPRPRRRRARARGWAPPSASVRSGSAPARPPPCAAPCRSASPRGPRASRRAAGRARRR
jgi:hypothetical protein